MAILTAILNTIVVLLSLFLICLVLIQRGKGGGLAGAFGGVGGSSAFGTKAGDVFTRVTVVVAGVWIFLSLILVVLYNNANSSAWGNDSGTSALSREVTPKLPTGKAKSAGGAAPVVPPISTTPPAAPAGSTGTTPAAIPEAPVTPAKTAK